MSNSCKTRPKPLMYVPKAIGQERIRAFQNMDNQNGATDSKYKILYDVIGKYDCCYMFYTAKDFIAMMTHFFTTLKADGLRIYIASYSKEGEDRVPVNYGELLTVIFSPTKNEDPTADIDTPKDMCLYYIISPNESFDANASLLNKRIAKEWVSNYQGIKLIALRTTVKNPEQGDTRSLYYSKKQISELVEEIKCQEATGLRAYFCTIIEQDNPFQSQLTLEFILTNRIGNDETEFYIDEREGFSNRPDKGNLDTGNPCPPAFCKGTELP